MRIEILVSSFVVALLVAKPADSCDMISVRNGLPDIDAARATGTVTGYGEVVRPVAGVDRAVSLLIKIDAVVSGRVSPGESAVVPLFYGPDCRSISMKYEEVVRQYPVGARVALSAARGGAPIVVEQNRGGYVVPLPEGIARTIDGDVDFARFDRSQYWQLGEFEFDKAVLELRRANQAQRFRRMLSLARYRGFHEWPDGSKWLRELMSQTRLTPAQRAEVTAVFQRSSADAR